MIKLPMGEVTGDCGDKLRKCYDGMMGGQKDWWKS